jgi:hypothetical protein
MNENITVAAFESMLPHGSELKRMIRRHRIKLSGNYRAFVDLLHEDLDECIYDLQKSPDLRQGDSEDRLTVELAGQLKRMGYLPSHGKASGGSVDLTIELGQLTWIGEAKKDQKFIQGFLQLTTRYRPASGNPSHNCYGLLFYLVKNTMNPTKKLDAWRTEMRKQALPDYADADCPKNAYAFYSQHRLEWSGRTGFIRHMIVDLQHDPKDKASEEKKKRAAKKATRGRALS